MSSRWEPSSTNEDLPSDALLAGVDSDGAAIYCGRAVHCGEELPAKVIPSKKVAYVAYNGEEHIKDTYEVLCGGDYRWESSSNGNVPENSLAIGRTIKGEKMYFGRANHAGSFTPGKVHPSHGCLYIPYNGKEVAIKEYEVLVMQ